MITIKVLKATSLFMSKESKRKAIELHKKQVKIDSLEKEHQDAYNSLNFI